MADCQKSIRNKIQKFPCFSEKVHLAFCPPMPSLKTFEDSMEMKVWKKDGTKIAHWQIIFGSKITKPFDKAHISQQDMNQLLQTEQAK